MDTNEDGDDNSEDDFQVTTIAGPQDDLKIVEGIGPKLKNSTMPVFIPIPNWHAHRLTD
ncbi:MAG: hypothetical protein R2792_10550 [Saprospiraceae bacterium]